MKSISQTQAFGRAESWDTVNLGHLDLNLLVALDALLTEQSITRAAGRLHLSPSATSGALSRLREYFGDELLTQVGRRMVPTPLGESLQSGVRDCLLHVQATVDVRPQFDPATSTRHFKLMMSDYVSTVLMPDALRRAELSAPGVTVELLSNSSSPWEILDRGEVDLLVLPEQFMRTTHPSEVLFEDDYVCVLAADNTKVGAEISVEQFLTLGHVLTRVGTQRPPTVDQWFFEKYGHKRRIEVVATSFTSAPHLIVGTSRIATMQRRLALIYCRALPLRIVLSPVPMPRLVECIQWHKYRDRDPGRVWLVGLLRDAIVAQPAATA